MESTIIIYAEFSHSLGRNQSVKFCDFHIGRGSGEFSLAKQSFSAIIAFDVIHLINDAQKILDRLCDLSKPRGRHITQTPRLANSG